MTTVADTIDAAFASALATVGGNPEIEIEPAGDPSRFPALEVYGGDWQVEEREADLIRWSMTVTVEGFVEGGGGAAPTQKRNALHADVVEKIMTDQALAGLVEIIEPGDVRRSHATLSNKRRLNFAQDFYVQFTTSRTNPAQPA